MTTRDVRVVPYGDDALLIEAESAESIAPWAMHARALQESGSLHVTDVVPGARTVLLDGVGGHQARDDLAAEVRRWVPTAADVARGPLVDVPVVFDGEDLATVADHWQVPVDEAVRLVTGAELRVAFCGFAPGFAYLAGLGLSVPRRATPRTRVPAGAVGLAGEFAGIYPRESPGGWQIIGTAVDLDLWDVTRAEPALLTPGTRVRFVDVGVRR